MSDDPHFNAKPVPTEDPIVRAHKEEFNRLKHTLAVVERIAMLAITRLGGTMRITDPEWASAENGDMQWRTVRPPPGMVGLQPEIHVAVTLQSEGLPDGPLPGLPPHAPEGKPN